MCVRACAIRSIRCALSHSTGGLQELPRTLSLPPCAPCDTLIARRKRYIPKRGGDSKRLMVDSVSGQAQKKSKPKPPAIFRAPWEFPCSYSVEPTRPALLVTLRARCLAAPLCSVTACCARLCAPALSAVSLLSGRCVSVCLSVCLCLCASAFCKRSNASRERVRRVRQRVSRSRCRWLATLNIARAPGTSHGLHHACGLIERCRLVRRLAALGGSAARHRKRRHLVPTLTAVSSAASAAASNASATARRNNRPLAVQQIGRVKATRTIHIEGIEERVELVDLGHLDQPVRHQHETHEFRTVHAPVA